MSLVGENQIIFRGGAGLILAQILYWFLPSHSPFTGEGFNQIYFTYSVQQDLCKSPTPQNQSQSPAACAFSHRMLRVEKRKALDRIQLKKCHPLTHCTSVTSLSQIITGFSAPSFLGFPSHTISMIPPSILLISQTHGCSLLNQASSGGGQTELQWQAELGSQLTVDWLLASDSSHGTFVLVTDL